MSCTFKRPAGLNFPEIHYEFQAKDRDSNEIVNYYVQDLTEDRLEEAINLMVEQFLPDETMCRAIGVLEEVDAVAEMCTFWRAIAKDGFSLVCVREGHNDIAAVNLITIHSRDDPKGDFQVRNEYLRTGFEFFETETAKIDVYEMFGVSSQMYAMGLCVHNAYRRRGIATEMLKARGPWLKKLGLTLTSTAFTGTESQKAAAQAGYKEIHVRSYEDIGRDYPVFDFSKSTTKEFKIMALQI